MQESMNLFNKEHRCLRCNRIIKDPLSIELGYGKICYKKIKKLDEFNLLFKDTFIKMEEKLNEPK